MGASPASQFLLVTLKPAVLSKEYLVLGKYYKCYLREYMPTMLARHAKRKNKRGKKVQNSK